MPFGSSLSLYIHKMPITLRLIFISVLVMTVCASISAQSSQSTSESNSNQNGYDPFSRSPIDQLRTRLRIKAEEKEFKENLSRVQEALKISNDLVKSVETNKAFSKEDRTKLERLEKIVKRVRNASGGNDDDVKVVDNTSNILSILKTIADEAKKLNTEFKKTKRTVISAPVIESANLIIDLIKIVKNLPA